MESRLELSPDALVLLKHQGGISAFKHLYGDYFVGGYKIGGDAAVALSESSFAANMVESLSVEVSVDMLFAGFSRSYTKFLRSSEAGSGFRVTGFDTLSRMWIPAGTSISVGSALKNANDKSAMIELAMQVNAMEKLVMQLPQSVLRQARDAGLQEEKEISWERLQEVLEDDHASCLVVEVILLPITTLRPVWEWGFSADVIGCPAP